MKYRVKKELNNWLKRNGYGKLKVARADEFYMDKDNDIMGVSDSYGKLSIDSFIELVDTIKLDYDTDLHTLYFLHELGHYNTEDEFRPIDEIKYNISNLVMDLFLKIIPTNKCVEIVNRIYQKLPQEYRATEWGVQFINKHPKQAKELEMILSKIYS